MSSIFHRGPEVCLEEVSLGRVVGKPLKCSAGFGSPETGFWDSQGYYTYVLGEGDSPPSWLPPDATWLPWGSTRASNILIFRNMLPTIPATALPYVGVEDIKASTEKAKSLGATICIGPQEIPNIGWFTMLTDPTQCTIALFQPKK